MSAVMFQSIPPSPIATSKGFWGVCMFLALIVVAEAQQEKKEKETPPVKTLEELAAGVGAFHTAYLGDTNVQIAENYKGTFEELAKKFDGRRIEVAFPIENVTGPVGVPKDPIEKQIYRLTLGAAAGLRGSNTRCIRSVQISLTKEQALKVSRSSVLVISGTVKLLRDATTSRGSLLSRDDTDVDLPASRGVIAWGDVTLLVKEPVFAILTQDKRVVIQQHQAGGEKKKDDHPTTKTLENELVDSAKAFATTNFGDTAPKRAENRKKAFEKLAKKYDGRKIKVVFPIRDVSGGQSGRNMSGNLGRYGLYLKAPIFPGSSWHLNPLYVGLTKEQALRVAPSSLLEVSGTIRLLLDCSLYGSADFFTKSNLKVIGLGGAPVTLALEKPTVRIVRLSLT